MSELPTLPFTGERFTPECVREIWYEHWHRYAFASVFARGKRVLDAACGEGYGAALLARQAASVVGVDLCADTIAHARRRYQGFPNLCFLRADVTDLPEGLGRFDLIVSFETLEHVAEQERMLAGLARLLAEDGLVLISSPERRVYSEKSGYRNPFHHRELTREELEALLRRYFPAFRLYGQKLLFQSALWRLDGQEREYLMQTMEENGELVPEPRYEAVYYLAVCARHPAALPQLPGLALFGDRAESVYRHYNEEVGKHIRAGLRIQELERELAALKGGGR
ncbi:MAG: hypothetical protein KatS3mg125_0816 [Lysobacterales bacterium]|jgi:SAM-dependent methyltransferase|nr:MAG: hypothetical protein KatS3mg125_0816 [Xanthomonadales bacterium]